MPAARSRATFQCPRCSAALRTHRSREGIFTFYCSICHWGLEGLARLESPRSSRLSGRLLWNTPPARPVHLLWLWPITLALLLAPIFFFGGFEPDALARDLLIEIGVLFYVVLVAVMCLTVYLQSTAALGWMVP